MTPTYDPKDFLKPIMWKDHVTNAWISFIILLVVGYHIDGWWGTLTVFGLIGWIVSVLRTITNRLIGRWP